MSAARDAPLPPAVWQQWLRPRQITQVHRVGGGFSGARVYRCRATGAPEDWALRCWPHGTAIDRVGQIHQLLQHARRQGCDAVPIQHRTADGLTVTQIDGCCWELAQWRPGRPFGFPRTAEVADVADLAASGSPLSAAVVKRGATHQAADAGAAQAIASALRAAAAAVAGFHAAVADVASSHAAAPAVLDRLRRIEQLDPLLRRLRSPAADWPPWLTVAAVVAARGWPAAMPSMRTQLAHLASHRRSLQHVLRDVHREHVLFDGPRVSGLIDFDAVRVDTPATDLARLVASFASDVRPPLSEERLWEAAELGYRQCRSISEEDLALARLLARVSPLISLVNWVVWVGVERRRFDAGEPRVAARVEHLSHLVRRTCIPGS